MPMAAPLKDEITISRQAIDTKQGLIPTPLRPMQFAAQVSQRGAKLLFAPKTTQEKVLLATS